MRTFKTPLAFGGVLVGLAIFGIANSGSAPEAISSISADEFVRALVNQRTPVLDLYFTKHLNPNARAGQDRPLLLAAVLQDDVETAHRLLRAGACADLADEKGLTPLMAAAMNGNADLLHIMLPLATNAAATDHIGRTALHYAVAAGKLEAVEILLPTVPDLGQAGKDGRDVLAMALEAADLRLTKLILDRLPSSEEWSPSALRALKMAIDAGDKDQIKLLLSKHMLPPTLPGHSVPLLAYSMASHDTAMFNLLVQCGADPNTVLPDKRDPDFLALLPPKLRNYLDGDKGVTLLILAAGLGESDYVRTLLQVGADRDRATGRYKMLPLYLAAQTGKWQCTQILLGSGPPPEQLRIEISLSSQHVAVIKDGEAIFSTACSTGRSGYSTRTGDYVITDKSRTHRSTIYKVDMPYFMRLSCLDFGMHEGVVPNYPASHGCIRLPGEAARKLFAEIPLGTLVTVK